MAFKNGNRLKTIGVVVVIVLGLTGIVSWANRGLSMIGSTQWVTHEKAKEVALEQQNLDCVQDKRIQKNHDSFMDLKGDIKALSTNMETMITLQKEILGEYRRYK